MDPDKLGKLAEAKINLWLNKPSDGYSFDRIPDQMTGYYMVSRNICDFHCYKYPCEFWIESKATEDDNFPFSRLTDFQRNGLRNKAEILGVFGLIIVLFASYKRAFVFDIRDIAELTESRTSTLRIKSININKISKWTIPYKEIQTIPSRQELLDYTGDLLDYLPNGGPYGRDLLH